MTRIKVCGLTTEACCEAVAQGVDLVGFNFWPRSKRHVTPERARVLAGLLPPHVQRVALFVDAASDEVRAAIEAIQPNWLQFHGHESPADCHAFGRPFFKAFRVGRAEDLAVLDDYLASDLVPEGATPFLVDAFVPGEAGGTGAVGRWDLAATVRDRGRLILAGGLSSNNVADAIEAVRPWAVDVASGVESAPGHKDPHLVSQFVAAVRSASSAGPAE